MRVQQPAAITTSCVFNNLQQQISTADCGTSFTAANNKGPTRALQDCCVGLYVPHALCTIAATLAGLIMRWPALLKSADCCAVDKNQILSRCCCLLRSRQKLFHRMPTDTSYHQGKAGSTSTAVEHRHQSIHMYMRITPGPTLP